MKLGQIVTEANIALKVLKDPKLPKQLYIAFTHDSSLPGNIIARLGTKPTVEQVVKAWSDLIDSSLRDSNYGDLSSNGKFDDWLLRLYISGQVDYEDINGEAGDALGLWSALSRRGRLDVKDQDFNKFKDIHSLRAAMNKPQYRAELERIKNSEIIEKHKRARKEVVLIDDDRFHVILPLNYGACYTFNNSEGIQANFCTGGSNGLHWFQNYAPYTPIISILDKTNMNNKWGKWQLHAWPAFGAAGQLVNAEQNNRGDLPGNDRKFAELFPGLMKRIVAALAEKGPEIEQLSGEPDSTGTTLIRGGYDIQDAISRIKQTFPASYASEEPGAEEPGAGEPAPGGEELY
jgi:hypothetical protein